MDIIFALIIGIILVGIGLLSFLNPNLVWKITESWKSYRADEASDFYVKTTKIGGVIAIIAGAVIAILPLFLL